MFVSGCHRVLPRAVNYLSVIDFWVRLSASHGATNEAKGGGDGGGVRSKHTLRDVEFRERTIRIIELRQDAHICAVICCGHKIERVAANFNIKA